MISYSWAQKVLVELLRKSFSIWIDEEQMIGDINEAIATAVRKSKNCTVQDTHNQLPQIEKAIQKKIHNIEIKHPATTLTSNNCIYSKAKLELESIGLIPVSVDEIVNEKLDAMLEGTREQLLKEISEWFSNPKSDCIFWLKGVAGSGKLVVAAQVTKMLQVSKINSCVFFCKYDVLEQSDPRKLIQTISYQLARCFPTALESIQREIADNSSILGSSISLMATKLILDPLKQCNNSNLVIVIDALDECRNRNEVIKVFNRIFTELPDGIKFFITSRPEHDIVKEMKIIGQEIILTAKYNIDDCFSASTNLTEQVELVECMAQNASGLFIWIQLAYDELENSDNIQESIENMLKLKGTDKLYNRIFQNFWAGLDFTQKIKAKHVLGGIVSVKYPLLSNALHELLHMNEYSIQFYVSRFRSILSTNSEGAIKVMHKSAQDYITDQYRNTYLSIDPDKIHITIANQLYVKFPGFKCKSI
ncbi:hypothetical protein HK100_008689 [Physocladia obscura]|uniref:Nephrocystin 3-like N-terminal domain-containing protein n=1 Tax=Physocladia obscura TaxID=109957 RepID=A0AAD5XEI5_9FUNG|nr:hypothetical protein HK100_008689 [Physocladia obscura]